MTREEKIEYLAKAVMTLSELGDGKTAYALNEIQLEMKSQLEHSAGLEEGKIADIIQNLFPTDQFIESESLLLDRNEAILSARHFAEWERKRSMRRV